MATGNNAVIYARYSSDKQSEQSIEGQLRVCNEYAQKCGFRVIGEYIDRALTGRYDDRPEFQKMIDDAEKRQFQYIIVYKLDRFARNRYDSAVYKHKLKKYNIRVISATENIGDNPESILLEALLEASAEYFSVDLSQKVKRGMNESALKANSCGGTIPLGYRIENKKLVADEKYVPIVQYIFNSYANGMSKKDIAKSLNEKGYRNSRGNPFRPNSFDNILSNKKYIGIYTYDEVEVENGCPAIIDKNMFEKCQNKLKTTKRMPAKAKAKIEYLLTGKLFCGMCGSHMVGESGYSSNNKNIYTYYACSKKKKERACVKKNEKKDFLEWYVVEQTMQYILSPHRLEFVADRVVEAYNKEFGDDSVKELEKQLKKIDSEFDSLVDTLIKTQIQSAIEKINEKLQILEYRKEDVSLELAKRKTANKLKLKASDVSIWLKQFCNGDPMDFDFRRKIIDTLVNAVYLFDDRVIIFYNIKEGKQISYIDMLESTELENLHPLGSSDMSCDGVPNK